MIKLHIYDMDGTILDSMWMWDNLYPNYLRSIGINPEPEIVEILDPMTLPEAMEYVVERYNIEGGIEQLEKDAWNYLVDQYEHKLELFDGAREELEQASSEGVPLVIFSNTPYPLVETALTRTGVIQFFSRIFTSEDIGLPKHDPLSFRLVCREMGVAPTDVLVHEDSDYARKAAEEAGCKVKWYDKYRGIAGEK